VVGGLDWWYIFSAVQFKTQHLSLFHNQAIVLNGNFYLEYSNPKLKITILCNPETEQGKNSWKKCKAINRAHLRQNFICFLSTCRRNTYLYNNLITGSQQYVNFFLIEYWNHKKQCLKILEYTK